MIRSSHFKELQYVNLESDNSTNISNYIVRISFSFNLGVPASQGCLPSPTAPTAGGIGSSLSPGGLTMGMTPSVSSHSLRRGSSGKKRNNNAAAAASAAAAANAKNGGSQQQVGWHNSSAVAR